MKNTAFLFLCAFCLMILMPLAPASAEDTLAPQDKAPPARAEIALQPGDQLLIYVYGDEDLSGEYRVDPQGVVTLPLIGEISTQGITKKQLEKMITDKLVHGGFYNDPKVTIDVSALQPFYILGEVKNPGSYAYTADLDVFKAIAIAGGYTPRADKEDIIITRKTNGQKARIQATEDTEILPGDSIKVEQRFF